MTAQQQTAPAKDIDEYLAEVPEEPRAALKELRTTIKSIIPDAAEVISYRIPTFKYEGQFLVAFSWSGFRSPNAKKTHCAFHLMSPPLMATLKDELKDYDTTAATIHFGPDKPLPQTLVERLIAARIEENRSKQMGYVQGKTTSEGNRT
jgi:uncharacterized protein YdhG (YjbR/CyaY superfamily)